MAEPTPPEAESGRRQAEEQVVVTGSRVPRKDLSSPGPVIVYGREEIAASGVASVGEFLRLTPWQGGGLNNNFDGGSDGSTQVSLRNLGARAAPWCWSTASVGPTAGSARAAASAPGST